MTVMMNWVLEQLSPFCYTWIVYVTQEFAFLSHAVNDVSNNSTFINNQLYLLLLESELASESYN